MAGAAWATNITQGECEPLVGGDSDEHGCKGSAGYSWDPTMKSCTRPWEKSGTLVSWAYGSGLTKYDTVENFGFDRNISRQEAAAIFARIGSQDIFSHLHYASYPDECNVTYTDEKFFDTSLKNDVYSACALGLMRGQGGIFSPYRELSRAEALAILMRAIDGEKQDESGAMWYEWYADRAHTLDILSFANFKGFDAPITRGELIEWLYAGARHMEMALQSDLIGTWNLVSYSGATTSTLSGITLEFQANRYYAKICNNISGSYTTEGNTITSGPAMSTMMYCESTMNIENAFDMSGATWSMTDGNLSIKTTKGDVFLWKVQ
jgi:heat shock protein HslJ